MTRIKPRRLDSIRKTLAGMDRMFFNRNDTNDQTKIYALENKMNWKSSYDTLGHFDKIHLRNMISPSNQKSCIKNSKRY